jgi:probable F420-dependent oxidoreductase
VTDAIRIGAILRTAATGAEWATLARRAEDAGMSEISASDHFGDQFAPVVALTAAAAATTSIRLTTDVLCNDFRHCAVLAKEIATLDRLSGGRVELGLGAGWMESEYSAAGLGFDPAKVRIDRLEASVGALRRLFDGERVTTAGWPHLDGFQLQVTPVQPRLPIAVGGGGRRMMSLAGRLADTVAVMTDNSQRSRSGWHPNATCEAAAQSIRWARDAAPDRFASLRLRTLVLMDRVGVDRHRAASALASHVGLSAEDVLRSPFALVGGTGDICDHLLRLRDELGITSFTVRAGLIDAMEPVIARLDER